MKIHETVKLGGKILEILHSQQPILNSYHSRSTTIDANVKTFLDIYLLQSVSIFSIKNDS